MQDFGKERVEERVTGVEGVEDKGEAMNEKFSLRLKSMEQKRKRLKLYHFEHENKSLENKFQGTVWALIPV